MCNVIKEVETKSIVVAQNKMWKSGKTAFSLELIFDLVLKNRKWINKSSAKLQNI